MSSFTPTTQRQIPTTDEKKPEPKPPYTETDWWKEDAERHNRMGLIAEGMGIQVGDEPTDDNNKDEGDDTDVSDDDGDSVD